MKYHWKDNTKYGILLGLLCGCVLSIYLNFVIVVEHIRQAHSFFILLLPVVGVWCVANYSKYQIGERNLLYPQIKMSVKRCLVIMLGTVVSHLVGASIGRENTATLISENLADLVGAKYHLTKEKINQLYIATLGIALAGTFGTPLAGIMLVVELFFRVKHRWDIIYITTIGCFMTYGICVLSCVNYPHKTLPKLQSTSHISLWLIILAILASLCLSYLLERSVKKKKKVAVHLHLSNKQWIIMSSVIVLILAYSFHLMSYLGMSPQMQSDALLGKISGFAFGWKIILTILCLGGGFRGGILTPALDISLAFGATLAMWLHGDVSILAALIALGTLAALSKAPLMATLISLNFFGPRYILLFLVVAIVVSAISRHKTIFETRKIY